MSELHEIEVLVQKVRSEIQVIRAEPSPGRKSLFPATWCEYASIVLAELLKRREFGIWTFVFARSPGSANGHAWLELRDTDGARLFTIDATIDQFEWGGNGPFVSEKQTPAAEVYPEISYVGPWEDWDVLEYDNSFRIYAREFIEQAHLI